MRGRVRIPSPPRVVFMRWVTPAEAAQLLAAENAQWGKVIRDNGAKAQ